MAYFSRGSAAQTAQRPPVGGARHLAGQERCTARRALKRAQPGAMKKQLIQIHSAQATTGCKIAQKWVKACRVWRIRMFLVRIPASCSSICWGSRMLLDPWKRGCSLSIVSEYIGEGARKDRVIVMLHPLPRRRLRRGVTRQRVSRQCPAMSSSSAGFGKLDRLQHVSYSARTAWP